MRELRLSYGEERRGLCGRTRSLRKGKRERSQRQRSSEGSKTRIQVRPSPILTSSIHFCFRTRLCLWSGAVSKDSPGWRLGLEWKGMDIVGMTRRALLALHRRASRAADLVPSVTSIDYNGAALSLCSGFPSVLSLRPLPFSAVLPPACYPTRHHQLFYIARRSMCSTRLSTPTSSDGHLCGSTRGHLESYTHAREWA